MTVQGVARLYIGRSIHVESVREFQLCGLHYYTGLYRLHYGAGMGERTLLYHVLNLNGTE